MGIFSGSCIALVTQPTRLEGLLERWSTKSAAKFRFQKFRAHEQKRRSRKSNRSDDLLREIDAEADFMLYEQEDERYHQMVERLRQELDFDLPIVEVPRHHIPNFMFIQALAVVVMGQDGLVANTAKYAQNLPIVGVNPDPDRIDGVLLPYRVGNARSAVKAVLDGKYQSRDVTLASAVSNDGQEMLAFNDFFIGREGHSSARYTIHCGANGEPQSSSGVIVATGAGSTGWMSSVLNMAQGIALQCGANLVRPNPPGWSESRLTWAVREPFVSKHSRASLVFGEVEQGQELVIESLMPDGGVVFSDGIASDFMQFNSGTIIRVGVAEKRAKLVVPKAWSSP